MIRLSISEDYQPPKVVTFNQASITIGRAPTCDLCLAAQGTSSRHCRIHVARSGYVVEDLGSTNGTYVNRHRLTSPQAVTAADEIVFATYRIRLVDDGAAVAAGVPSQSVAQRESSAPSQAGRATGVPSPGRREASAPSQAGQGVPSSGRREASAPSQAGRATGAPSPGRREASAPSQAGQGVPSPGRREASAPSQAGQTGPSSVRRREPSGWASRPVTGDHVGVGGEASTRAGGSMSGLDDPAWVREWERIDKLAQQWLASGRERARLLRGVPLAHAKQWLAAGRGRQPAPKSEHRQFVLAGVRAAQFRLVRNVMVAAGLLGAVVVVGVQIGREPESKPVPGPGERIDSKTTKDTEQSAEGAVVAGADALVARAEALREEDSELAALLAIEALTRFTGPGIEGRGLPAERLLRSVLAKSSGRPLSRPGDPVVAVAMSPDGRFAVTAHEGSDRNAARLWDLQRGGLAQPQMLRGHFGPVRTMAFSRDGRVLVTAGQDETVLRWDLGSPERPPPVRTFGVQDVAVHDVDLSADGRWLLVGGASGRARLFDLDAPDGAGVALEGHTAAVTAVDLNAGATVGVTASEDGTALLWKFADGRPSGRVGRLEGHVGAIHDAAISPDGAWVVTGAADNNAILWDPRARAPWASARVLAGHTAAVRHVAISADSRYAVTAGDDGVASVWKLFVKAPELAAPRDSRATAALTGLAVRGPGSTPEQAPAHPWAVTASADGSLRTVDLDQIDKVIAGNVIVTGAALTALDVDEHGIWAVSGDAQGRAEVWDLGDRKPAGLSLPARGHLSQVLDAVEAAGGTRLLTAGADGTVRYWDTTRPVDVGQLGVFPGHRGAVRAVAVHDNIAVSAGDDGMVRLWGLDAPKPAKASRALKGHSDRINDLVFAADGRLLVSISDDRTARVWNMRQPDPTVGVAVLRHDSEVTTAAMDPGSHWLITGSIAQLNLWDLTQADPAASTSRLQEHDTDILRVAMGPGGRWAASSDDNGKVILWDLGAGATPLRLRGHQEGVDVLAFSGDGQWLATGSRDRSVRLWRLQSDHPDEDAVELGGHEQGVRALTWSPDSKWLYSGSNDGVVRAWPIDASDLSREGMVFDGHSDVITALLVAPDGSHLITASYDGAARLWPLVPRGLTPLGCMLVGRDVTAEEFSAHIGGRSHRVCE